MPRISGSELLEWIQSSNDPYDFPVIVLSGSSKQSDKKQALDLGARVYWVKPTELQDLAQLARELKDCWLSPPSHV